MKVFPLFLLMVFPAFAGSRLCVDFEDGKLPERFVIKAPNPSSITVQSSVVRKGKSAARFELKKGDVFMDAGEPEGFRAELKDVFRAKQGSTLWYAVSMYLPKDFPIHQNRLVLGQWNAEPDAGEEVLDRSPPLSQRYSDGKFKITLQAETVEKHSIYETKKFTLGVWHDFVYQVKWSHKKDGFVRAWMDGKRILTYKGPVGYDDKVGPYFKFGLYRDDVPETYVAYFDHYCRGDTRKDVEF